MKFTELNLHKDIQDSLTKMGFLDLTPIQEVTYPIIASGKDLCALAETGSGKTAACAIPLIEKIDTSLNAIQGLVIVPTRELSLQYVNEIQEIANKTQVVPFAIYGGFDKGIQTSKLNHGVHILVATPGRLIDLLHDGIISFAHVKCAILDEADELLKVGFLEDIEFIMSCIRGEHQTLLFSATMAEEIKKLANDCLKDPVHISLITDRATPLSIEHYFRYVHPKTKQTTMINYIKAETISQLIIFCNARHQVDKLYQQLRKEIDEIDYIHAGLQQSKRSSIIEKFRNQKLKYLIATDVAGRGLDFSHVSHIINWDFPLGNEQYMHRTGRAGRMGRKGKALTFVTDKNLKSIKELELKKQIKAIWIEPKPFCFKRKHKPL